MGKATILMQDNIKRIEKINEQNQRREDLKHKKIYYIRRLKNDIVNKMKFDLKSDINITTDEYKQSVFEEYIKNYLKFGLEAQELRLILDESFLKLYNEAQKRNHIQRQNEKAIYIEDLAPLFKWVDSNNKKALKWKQANEDKGTRKNYLLILINMIFKK